MKIPKIETLVILIFFGAVCLWGISKCRTKQATLAAREKKYSDDDEDRPSRRDTVFVPQQPQAQQPSAQQSNFQQQPSQLPQQQNQQQQPNVATTPGRQPSNTPATAPAPTTSSTPATPKYSTLYVTIDGLKIRKEPGLKGDVVAKLELYEPVSFLNQKTEWTQEISLGKENVTDHWVKVRNRAGKEGWVFGAGVHYYKMKRKGVLE